MENNLQIFKNEQFGEVRTIEENGNVLFCGSDVAKALGYTNPSKALGDHCKGITKRYTPTNGGKQELSFIPESDLYRLTFSSKLPAAEKFTDWVTDEVLPTIRKHGAYMTPEVIEKTLLNPDYIIQLATTLKGEMEKRKQLEAKVERDKPLVQFAEHVGSTSDCLTIRQFAKIVNDETIPLGEKRLFKWLRERKYLDQNNVAYQRYIDSGYFNVREVSKNTVVGARVFPQTIVTGKGQIYLLSKLREEFC